MTSGGNRSPANPETGGWMDRMRRRRFTPTASFTHGRGTNPNGSRQVRAQCNSARTSESPTAAPWLLLDYDVVNFRHHVNLDTGDVRLHIVVEPVLEVIPALPYLRHVKLAVSHEGHVGDESRRGQKGGRQLL